MAPVRNKRARRGSLKPEERRVPSILLSDRRTDWLVKADDDSVELKAKGATFTVSKLVLTRNSEYFERCLNGQFEEANGGLIDFGDDVDPRFLALYIGVAYSFSSLVPHAPPLPAETPEASAPNAPLQDYIEVFKLCDRFISPKMGSFMSDCIKASVFDYYHALFRADADADLENRIIRHFSDGYEILDMRQTDQLGFGKGIINHFCEGINYDAWVRQMQGASLVDRPRFVAAVSLGFAQKLHMLQNTRKLKRKELKQSLWE